MVFSFVVVVVPLFFLCDCFCFVFQVLLLLFCFVFTNIDGLEKRSLGMTPIDSPRAQKRHKASL